MILSEYNNTTGILYTKYEGIIKLEDFLSDIEKVGEDFNLSRELKIISDARNAKFIFLPRDISVILDKVKTHIKKFTSVKEGIIQNNPYVTALSMLYQLELSKLNNFYYQIFSTIETCEKWILE